MSISTDIVALSNCTCYEPCARDVHSFAPCVCILGHFFQLFFWIIISFCLTKSEIRIRESIASNVHKILRQIAAINPDIRPILADQEFINPEETTRQRRNSGSPKFDIRYSTLRNSGED